MISFVGRLFGKNLKNSNKAKWRFDTKESEERAKEILKRKRRVVLVSNINLREECLLNFVRRATRCLLYIQELNVVAR